MVARTRPPTFRVLAAWEPSFPPHRPAPESTSDVLPRVVLSSGPVTRLTLRVEPTARTLYHADPFAPVPRLEFTAAIALPPMDLAPPPPPPPARAEPAIVPILPGPPETPSAPPGSTESPASPSVIEAAIPDTTPEYLEPLTVMADELPADGPPPEKPGTPPLAVAEPPSPPITPSYTARPPPTPAPGLYDLPGLLARILSVSAGLRAAGEMRLGVRESQPTALPPPPRAPPPEPVLSTPEPEPPLLLPDAPTPEESPAPPAPMLAALPVFHWRDWHRPAPHAHEETRPAPTPEPEAASFSRSTAQMGAPPPATTLVPPDGEHVSVPAMFPHGPAATASRGPGPSTAPTVRVPSAIAKPHPPPEDSDEAGGDEPGELVPLARPARYRWRMYRDRLVADSDEER